MFTLALALRLPSTAVLGGFGGSVPPSVDSGLLLEDGTGYILMEDGSRLLLE